MAHLSPEQLAALGSDPSYAPSPAERAHLQRCRPCADQAAELNALVDDVRQLGPATLRAPHPDVWTAIEHELDETPAARPRAARPRRTWIRPAAAAVAGLVVGVGATFVVSAARTSDGPALVAQTSLAPLPGEAGQGTAELVRSDDTLQLRVHVALGTSPASDYHEVWLINRDGHRMYALGVLPSSGDGSYWLPVALSQQLDGYETVDISLEPEDGNAAHSQHSVVRGQLPV